LNIYNTQGSYTLLNSVPYKRSDYEVNKIIDANLIFNNEVWLSNDNKIEFGLQSTNHNITYQQDIDTSESLFLQRIGNETALYLQLKCSPFAHLSVTPGIRSTYSNLADKLYIEPRFSAIYFLSDDFSFKCAVSRHSQLINKSSFNNNTEAYRDFWYLADKSNLAALTSNHFIAGCSFSNKFFDIDVECYYMKFDGLSEIKQNIERNLLSIDDNIYTGNGYSKGIDLFVYKKAGMYNVWAGYSYCQSKNKFAKINNGVMFPSDNDQRHEFKIVNMFHISKWVFSSVWVYGSGNPYTSYDAGFYLNIPNGDKQFFLLEPIQNTLRLPAYHRLDISCTYTLKGKWYVARIGASIINLYGRNNTKSLYNRVNTLYDNNGNKNYFIEKISTNSLGFTPNLFINFTF